MLQYKGGSIYLGESVKGLEIGIWNWWDSLCIAVRDGKVGTSMDMKAGQHDSNVHVQGFPTWREKQTIVTSLDVVTVIVLM